MSLVDCRGHPVAVREPFEAKKDKWQKNKRLKLNSCEKA